VGPNRRSGKDGTGKHGTKAYGWKSQDWKTRDQIYRGRKGGTGKRGNIMCMGTMTQLLRYVERQWIKKSTVGPSRLSVRDNPSRTNNSMESFHAALRRRIKVSHPNLFAFLGHLQRTTVDSQANVSRLSREMTIRARRNASTSSTIHESRPVCVGSTTTSTPNSNF